MRVLVVGGTGLIGWHAVCELRRRNHAVTAIARRPPGENLFPAGVRFLTMDVVEATGVELSGVIEGHDAIVHAAGTDPRVVPRGSAREYFHRVNVEATGRLFRYAREAGVLRAVLLTSYFHALKPGMADVHPYVRSRVESEQSALKEATHGLELIILQPPYVFGTVPNRKTMGTMIKRYVLSPFPLFAPKGGTNAMSANALAQAVAGALERGIPGQKYLVGGENLTWADLVSRFARIAGHPKCVRVIPKKYFHCAMRIASLCLRLFRRESGLAPVPLTDVITEEMYFDPTPSAELLGYRTDDLDETIGEIVQGVSPPE